MATKPVLGGNAILISKEEIQSRVKELAQQINFDYKGKEVVGEDSTGSVMLKHEISTNIKGKHVLIVEDILDTGLTLSNVSIYLSVYDPLSVKIAVLLDKPARRRIQIKPDYVGFKIENRFVYGYGLDYKQRFRNLPEVRMLE